MTPEKAKAPATGTRKGFQSVKNQATKQGINMSDSTEVQVSSQPAQQTFNFEGHEVRVFMKDADPWFVAADLCKALNLTNSRVALKALSDDEKGVSSTYTLGGEQELAVVSEGGMWTLVLRCRDAVIEGTVPYRVRRWVTNEVLPAIRKTGVYVGKPFSVNPTDVLTQEEQNTLRLMLKTAVERMPKEKQGALMMQGWSKLKAHFKVSYREIPRHEFSEAVSIIARHTAEWEVLEREPAAAQPAPLPRLHLHQVPPPIGSYRYSPANPYPANGRTIEMAKSITADIRNWSDSLPAGPARNDLHDAAQMLYDLLVSGWTEVDEALGQIHAAMHYLNRWQGRGGRMGNVR